MEISNPKQRWITGNIVQIPLSLNRFGYGQLLTFNNLAVFSICTAKEPTKEEILSSGILFVVAVYKQAVTTGKWKKIGKDKPVLSSLPFQFIQDKHHPESIQIYHPETGQAYPSNREQCKGLERCAVWEGSQVEERIQDYFDGRKNRWLSQLQLI